MSRIIIHIGLHKTATRFLQRAVFSNLDPAAFLYNPPELMRDLRRTLRPDRPSHLERLRKSAEKARTQAADRTLIVSDPEISGRMFENHSNYERNLELMRELFPEASIMYFVRHPSDWLHSAYRQSLVKGRSAPIDVFLNYRDGKFQPRLAKRVDGMRTIDARALRFLDIYRAYAEAYGPERVYLIRQEDLKERLHDVCDCIADALEIEQLPELPRGVSGNRAFSALAIRLFYPGTARTPDLNRVALSDEDMHGRRNPLVQPLRQLRTVTIRHVFDRLLYVDWDLLEPSGMRAWLDEHYAEEYRRLTAAAEIILVRGPGPEALAAANGEQ